MFTDTFCAPALPASASAVASVLITRFTTVARRRRRWPSMMMTRACIELGACMVGVGVVGVPWGVAAWSLLAWARAARVAVLMHLACPCLFPHFAPFRASPGLTHCITTATCRLGTAALLHTRAIQASPGRHAGTRGRCSGVARGRRPGQQRQRHQTRSVRALHRPAVGCLHRPPHM